jgi:DNA mismatch repair protein MutS
VTPCDDEVFEHRRAYESLLAHLHVVSLEGFGCEALPAAVSAAGAALHYAKETRRSALGHVTSLSTRISARTMLIDAVSLRNLEILQNIRNGSAENTLFSLLDLTVTSMGNRLLRKYLATPLLSPDEINGRLDAVEYLLRRMPLRHSFRTTIARCADIERISGRIALGTAGPRDLLALAASLECIPEIKSHFRQSGEEIPSALLAGALDAMHEYGPVIDQVRNAIIDEPPATLRNGGVIRPGYDKELDELKRISTGGKDWIAELQQRERERTGIRSLKIGYNRIFGYYIEVTRPNLPLVPKEYERKQTTAGGERFTLPELREKESLIATADERFIAFEGRIYETLIGDLKPHIPGFQETANGLATSDVCAALAEAADKYRYARPVIDESREILIREGRHPVVERSVTGGFVPNDTLIDAVKDQILVITGANMAGKSTYMRGVALICIMAQAGSFVPAAYAKIGLVDRIFTRVGAFDDLASGQSTFMVEMIELANILNTMTDRSLVILDEIGRGTSTIDGYSIAKAVLEFLHGKGTSGARTLFATHFHELIGIESELKRVRNYHFAVKESKNDVIFLRKLIPGATDRSYGIHVARLAGIPSRVTARADLILREVADREILPGRKARRYTQLLLMDNGHIPSQEDHPVVRELKTMDLDGITPLQALSRLAEMQKKLKNIDREESG